MIEMFEEAFESIGFWLLFGGASAAVILGWILGKNMMGYSFPLWQILIILVGVFVASAFFAARN